jgi:hypothetical protein
LAGNNDQDVRGTDKITVKDAYIAMYRFVDAYFGRGGRRQGDLTLLVHDLSPSPDPNDETALWTADPAFWSDWLDAVRATIDHGLTFE